jgi:uncharacterized Zn finger protein
MSIAGGTTEREPAIDDAQAAESSPDSRIEENIQQEQSATQEQLEMNPTQNQSEERLQENQSEVTTIEGQPEPTQKEKSIEVEVEVSENGLEEAEDVLEHSLEYEDSSEFEDEEEEEEEEEYTHCPSCLKNQPHERLNEKKKGQGVDILARCEACGKVHTVEFRPPKEIKISFTLSDGAYSEPVDISTDEDERLRIEDIFEHDDALWRITRMDDESGRGMRRARTDQIASAWAVRCDTVRLKLTMTIGDISNAATIECEPSKMFSCGTIMEVAGKKWRIRAIHTGQGKTLSGKRPAHMIRRIFLHPPPSKTEWREERGTGGRRSTGRDFDRRNSQTRDPRGRDWSGRDDLRDEPRRRSPSRDEQQDHSDYDD